MKSERWFAWYPVKVRGAGYSPIYPYNETVAFLKWVRRCRVGTANSYGADERDAAFSWVYFPDKKVSGAE